MDMSKFSKLGDELPDAQREQFAFAAILSEFGTGDIGGDRRYKYLVHKGIEVLYAIAGWTATEKIGNYMELMSLDTEGPIPGFPGAAIRHLDEIRSNRVFRQWPKCLTYLRRELESCIES